jgi:phospholipase C
MILPNIDHFVVVMFENRSLDAMLGNLYSGDTPPARVLPPGSAAAYDGLRAGLSNPALAGYFAGSPCDMVAATSAPVRSTSPNPDPQETWANVTYQLYGPQGEAANPTWPMLGFVANYATTGTTDPTQIMQCREPAELPVLSTLARSYAVSDAWFASVPSQTWPNRAFAHAGTSNGRVDNGNPPDPLDWNVPTIFNVLESIGAAWCVYKDTTLTPSLTRTMFPKLWDPRLDARFRGFDAFIEDCAQSTLPRYAFIEPSFLIDPNDQHPPHDVNAGESFLHAIWSAVSTSPAWNRTLLLITYDEHGGCYDHRLPPAGAAAPDRGSSPGDQGFAFTRFGVRVPAVLVSPCIAPGTVFRSDTKAPYDHTSILATLRDWLGIGPASMLPSARIGAAPTLAQVLTLETPRTDLPAISAPAMSIVPTPLTTPPNDLQKSLVSGAARRAGLDPVAALRSIATRQHAVDFFGRIAASSARS